MKEMLISVLGEDVQVALLKNNRLWHFFMEENQKHSLRGNIYLGYVERVIPGLESAFINIGLERCAFLHRKDIVSDSPQAKISDLLSQGQYILVQIVKDPIGRKGARLTASLTLSSWYLVYQPYDTRSTLSQSIEELAERERLHTWLQEYPGVGLIVRTAAAYQSLEKLTSDFERLKKRWSQIKELLLARPNEVFLVHEEEALPMRIFRDFMKYAFDRIIINDAFCGQKLQEIVVQQGLNCEIKIVPSNQRFFSEYQVYDQFCRALSRYVPLKSGANLVIEQTESMVTIDVNTSRFIGKSDQRQTILKTNLEAAQAIAQQVQLRELGGIIVIDFIDMIDKEDRHLLYQALCEHFSTDHMPVHILPMSELGLIQMTRKRHHESVMEEFRGRCPTCHQKASIIHHRLLAMQLIDKVLLFSQSSIPEKLLIVARKEVTEYLQQKEESWKKTLNIEFQQWQYHVDESNDLNFAEVYLSTHS